MAHELTMDEQKAVAQLKEAVAHEVEVRSCTLKSFMFGQTLQQIASYLCASLLHTNIDKQLRALCIIFSTITEARLPALLCPQRAHIRPVPQS